MARTNLTRLPKETPPAEAQAADSEALLDEQIQMNAAYRSSGVPPDWLTTGLAGAGAGWVFGPVGALIAGTVTAIVGQKRKAGVLAAATADAKTGAQLIDGGEQAVKRLEAAAVTPQDKLEAALVRDQYEQSAILAQSPNPQVASQGFSSLLSIPGLVSGEADEIEAATIARAELEQTEFSNEIGRADGIRNNVQREGASFGIRQDAYERMLVVDDTAAGDQVLLVNSFKMVDPNSAVLPGEAATAANTAGIPDWMVTLYNRGVRSGERLEPDQRQDLIRQAGLQYGVARSDQVDRNTDAIERGRSQGIRDDLLNQIPMRVKSQDELPYATPPRGRDETVEAGLRGPIQAPIVPESIQGLFPGDVDPNVFTREDGSTVRRVDRGEGRFEWQPESPAPPPEFGMFDTSPAAREQRNKESRERMRESPGLFQPGGVFGGPPLPPEQPAQRETN